MQYIEESIVSSSENKLRDGLDKAKEASSKERNLIRLQDQAGLSDAHNLDLTFAVSYFNFLTCFLDEFSKNIDIIPLMH